MGIVTVVVVRCSCCYGKERRNYDESSCQTIQTFRNLLPMCGHDFTTPVSPMYIQFLPIYAYGSFVGGIVDFFFFFFAIPSTYCQFGPCMCYKTLSGKSRVHGIVC
jgi:hypothetical protein